MIDPNTKKLEEYIDSYWDSLLVVDTLESKNTIGLPNPYFAPSTKTHDGFSFKNMFYWDSYFIVQGLWGGKHEDKIVGIVNNMIDLINRFGFVPNSSGFSHLSRSQPPLLSSLVIQIIDRIEVSQEWIQKAYEAICFEYKNVWLCTEQPHNRNVFEGLSRYYDANLLDVLAEAESGWDYTTRFGDNCLLYLPVDLNCFLYKYETDLSSIAAYLEDKKSKDYWLDLAESRKLKINELMWHKHQGLFYDYNYQSSHHSPVASLAAYASMFVGLATPEQAALLVQHLKHFETDHGLTATNKNDPVIHDRQWASPNGWAPLHDIVVDGLIQYGYEEEAYRIAAKWVATVSAKFSQTGLVNEKYNMLDPAAEAASGVYPSQHGFGWTNGVTKKFIHMLEESDS